MAEISEIAAIVRRNDPDRFLTVLFAPAAHREDLFLLYAFNHELARAREAVREPMLALVRLQWWREVAEGARRRHEVAGPLGEAIDAGRLPAADLLTLIEGREAEADDAPADTASWRAYVDATAGGLAVAAGTLLGAAGPVLARIRTLGTAYGVAGQLRSVAALARQGRCMLPADLLEAHGLTPDAVIANPAAPGLAPVRAALAGWGRGLLAEAAGPLPREVIAAALPAVLARHELRSRRDGDDDRSRGRGLGPRVAVALAAAVGAV